MRGLTAGGCGSGLLGEESGGPGLPDPGSPGGRAGAVGSLSPGAVVPQLT